MAPVAAYLVHDNVISPNLFAKLLKLLKLGDGLGPVLRVMIVEPLLFHRRDYLQFVCTR